MIALGIEYSGTHFHGWQKQPNIVRPNEVRPNKIRTVQSVLEKALSQIADEPVETSCAGRTDTGVHGLAQVVHFKTTKSSSRKLDAWTLGSNSILPPDVRVLWAEAASDDFHARFSALARTYQYIILNTRSHSALFHDLFTWERQPLDATLMHEAGQLLLGENDFSSFRSSECQSVSPNRNVQFLQVERKRDRVILTIRANAFLHHMVRNIAGVLMDIGTGKQNKDWIKTVLDAKNRHAASRTAAPNGLYLVKVDYPDNALTKNYARFPIY